MAHITIASSPYGEDCAQLGTEGYEIRARAECEALIAQLKRHYKASHSGRALPCRLVVASNPHDFGTYHDVRAIFEEDSPGETAAYWLESNTPEKWDDEAVQALAGFLFRVTG